MCGGFAESDSDIEGDLFGVDSGGLHGGQLLCEERADFSGYVRVAGVGLHGGGGALHMHADVACLIFGEDLPHGPGVMAVGLDIIDDAGSGLECLDCDLRLSGIH